MIGLRECFDAEITRRKAGHHALQPEGFSHRFRNFCARAVVAIERHRQVFEELAAVGKNTSPNVIEYFHRQPARIRVRPQHQGRNRPDEHRLRNTLCAVARKVAREIGALPAEAVAISRKLLRPSPEDLTRRIDQESHLFGERMRSTEAVAAFKAFFARKKA